MDTVGILVVVQTFIYEVHRDMRSFTLHSPAPGKYKQKDSKRYKRPSSFVF